MNFVKTEKGYLLTLSTGENIHASLTEFCRQQNIRTAVFKAIGAASNVTLGFYDLMKKEYIFQEMNRDMEVVSLTGNVAILDGEPFLHLHGVFSDSKFQCYGGHVKDALVGASLEVHLNDLGVEIEREFDETTGLKLLNCK